MNPTQLTYRTTATRERSGLYGDLMRLISTHPILSGVAGGVLATLIAAARSWRGVSQAPGIAAALAIFVTLVWIIIFWGMRRFFAAQTQVDVEVTRRFTLTEEHLSFREDGKELFALDNPTLTLATLAIPNGTDTRPWSVWLTWKDASGETFTVETRITSDEARQFPVVEHPMTPHETLPPHIASPILEVARAQL